MAKSVVDYNQQFGILKIISNETFVVMQDHLEITMNQNFEGPNLQLVANLISSNCPKSTGEMWKYFDELEATFNSTLSKMLIQHNILPVDYFKKCEDDVCKNYRKNRNKHSRTKNPPREDSPPKMESPPKEENNMEESENQNKRSLRKLYDNESSEENLYEDYSDSEDLAPPKELIQISTSPYTTQKPRIIYTTSKSQILQTEIQKETNNDMLIFRMEDINTLVGMSSNLAQKTVETIARYPKIKGYNVLDTMTAAWRIDESDMRRIYKEPIRFEFRTHDKIQVPNFVPTYFDWSDNESKAYAVSYNSLKVDGRVMADQPTTETVLAFSRDATLHFFLAERLEGNLEIGLVMVLTFIDKANASDNNSTIIITTSEGATSCKSHILFTPRIEPDAKQRTAIDMYTYMYPCEIKLSRSSAVKFEIDIPKRIKNSPYSPVVIQFIAVKITALAPLRKRRQVAAGAAGAGLVFGAMKVYRFISSFENDDRKKQIIEIKDQLEKLSNADRRGVHELRDEIVNLGNEVAQISKEAIGDLCAIEEETTEAIQIEFIETSINRILSRINGLAINILSENLLSTDPIMQASIQQCHAINGQNTKTYHLCEVLIRKDKLITLEHVQYDLSTQQFVTVLKFKCPIFKNVNTTALEQVSFHYVFDVKNSQNSEKYSKIESQNFLRATLASQSLKITFPLQSAQYIHELQTILVKESSEQMGYLPISRCIDTEPKNCPVNTYNYPNVCLQSKIESLQGLKLIVLSAAKPIMFFQNDKNLILHGIAIPEQKGENAYKSMVFTRYQKSELTIKCNTEKVHLPASRQHIPTEITVSGNPNATESFIESELTNLFKNQSHLKLETMILHNNFEGNMTDIDKSYEVNFPIINKTLKLESEKRAYILLGIIMLIMLISLYCAKRLIVKLFLRLRNTRRNRNRNDQNIRLEPMRLSRRYRNSRRDGAYRTVRFDD